MPAPLPPARRARRRCRCPWRCARTRARFDQSGWRCCSRECDSRALGVGQARCPGIGRSCSGCSARSRSSPCARRWPTLPGGGFPTEVPIALFWSPVCFVLNSRSRCWLCAQAEYAALVEERDRLSAETAATRDEGENNEVCTYTPLPGRPPSPAVPLTSQGCPATVVSEQSALAPAPHPTAPCGRCSRARRSRSWRLSSHRPCIMPLSYLNRPWSHFPVPLTKIRQPSLLAGRSSPDGAGSGGRRRRSWPSGRESCGRCGRRRRPRGATWPRRQGLPAGTFAGTALCCCDGCLCTCIRSLACQ